MYDLFCLYFSFLFFSVLFRSFKKWRNRVDISSLLTELALVNEIHGGFLATPFWDSGDLSSCKRGLIDYRYKGRKVTWTGLGVRGSETDVERKNGVE